MKRFLLFTFYFLFFTFYSKGQINIVPNFSFETYTNCPSSADEFNFVVYWYSPTKGTPDYFNVCSPYPSPHSYSVPNNVFGYQQARTGVGYCGIAVYDPVITNYREYIQTELTTTILKGHHYCVSFYVSLASSSEYAVSDIGLLFSTKAIGDTSNSTFYDTTLNCVPQIKNSASNSLTDTTNWVKINGSFTADSTYKYITIGNFNDDVNSHIISWNATDTSEEWAYYYVDDVSIIELPYQSAGVNTTICKDDSVQIGSLAESNFTYKWFPEAGLRLTDSTNANPYVKPTQTTTYYLTVQDSAGCSNTDSVTISICEPQIPNVITPNGDGKNDAFYIENLPAQSTLLIYNRWGNTIYQSLNYQNNWEADGLNAGTYYYLLTLPSGEVKKGFVEVIK